MVAFGMPCDDIGSPKRNKDWRHIDTLSTRYESYRSGGEFADYCCDDVDAFANWHTSDRYANQTEFDAGYVEVHRRAADAIRDLVHEARRRGVIE
ncbi:Uncharacterised protein [Serratia quinivorans]|nr:Uncharacterised protein [Serratia quinivorans]CAI1952785.1 Uncharacterised protein [Serratia quinivorans]